MTSSSTTPSSHALRKIKNKTLQHCLHSQSTFLKLTFQQQSESRAHKRIPGPMTLLCFTQSYLLSPMQRDQDWRNYSFSAWLFWGSTAGVLTQLDQICHKSSMSWRAAWIDSPLCWEHRQHPHTLGLCSQLYSKWEICQKSWKEEGKSTVSHTKPGSTPPYSSLIFTSLFGWSERVASCRCCCAQCTRLFSSTAHRKYCSLLSWIFNTLLTALRSCHAQKYPPESQNSTLPLIYFWNLEWPYLPSLCRAETSK